MNATQPTEFRVSKDRKVLTISWSDGTHAPLSAEMLRVMSPSAEVQGHSEEQRKVVGGKRNVMIIGVDMVGNYAVRISFDDMHSTGIFSWSYLRELIDNRAERWAQYERELAQKGLTR